jgi:hypothetical protein
LRSQGPRQGLYHWAITPGVKNKKPQCLLHVKLVDLATTKIMGIIIIIIKGSKVTSIMCMHAASEWSALVNDDIQKENLAVVQWDRYCRLRRSHTWSAR